MQLGQEMGYGAFPVGEDSGLVGIVTESDTVRPLTKILGLKENVKRVAIKTNKKFGNLKDIMKILGKNQVPLLSLLALVRPEEDNWLVVLRLKNKKSPKHSGTV